METPPAETVDPSERFEVPGAGHLAKPGVRAMLGKPLLFGAAVIALQIVFNLRHPENRTVADLAIHGLGLLLLAAVVAWMFSYLPRLSPSHVLAFDREGLEVWVGGRRPLRLPWSEAQLGLEQFQGSTTLAIRRSSGPITGRELRDAGVILPDRLRLQRRQAVRFPQSLLGRSLDEIDLALHRFTGRTLTSSTTPGRIDITATRRDQGTRWTVPTPGDRRFPPSSDRDRGQWSPQQFRVDCHPTRRAFLTVAVMTVVLVVTLVVLMINRGPSLSPRDLVPLVMVAGVALVLIGLQMGPVIGAGGVRSVLVDAGGVTLLTGADRTPLRWPFERIEIHYVPLRRPHLAFRARPRPGPEQVARLDVPGSVRRSLRRRGEVRVAALGLGCPVGELDDALRHFSKGAAAVRWPGQVPLTGR